MNSQVERNVKKARFQQTQCCHKYNFIPIAYTSRSIFILMWKDFEDFYTLIDFIEPLETYLHLTHFFISWFVFKKDGSLPLVGPRCEPPTLEGLWLRGVRK